MGKMSNFGRCVKLKELQKPDLKLGTEQHEWATHGTCMRYVQSD